MNLSSLLPESGVQIECDGYVPLIARSVGCTAFPLQYWRTGDFKKSLIEVGVDPSNGAICKITVTSLAGIGSHAFQMADLSATQAGLPCISLEDWAGSSRKDVEQPVEATLIGNRLVLQFGPQRGQLTTAIRNGRVVFQIDQSRIISGIEILELSTKELEEFRYAVGITA
jgi:hypothetical protein